MVTEVRIIKASAPALAAAIIFFINKLLTTGIVAVSETLNIILPIYFTIFVYKEVRRNEKQIAANQVSLEAREKLLKKKKAFYTTVIVLLCIFLCYLVPNIFLVALASFKEKISTIIRVSALYIFSLLTVLNSMFNPLIYAFRIRHFRVAFIRILSRKTTAQAEELEQKIFGTRRIGVNGENQTRQADPHRGLEETPL